jgi:hypothetical protein
MEICWVYASRTGLKLTCDPSTLRPDERLFVEVSRQCSPGSPPERTFWLAAVTEPGAAAEVDLFSAYVTRHRALYPGQRVSVRYRTSVNGVMGPPAVATAVVEA